MTILVDYEIENCIAWGDLVIDPYDKSLINPASLDFRLGNIFGEVKVVENRDIKSLAFDDWCTYKTVNPLDKDTFTTTKIESDKFVLEPKKFILATSLEKFDFKGNICARVMGKSSLGRIGLMNSSVAGFIDPGFNSYITLELFNYSDNEITLTKGMKIGQLIIEAVSEPNQNYKITGRYCNQKPGEGSKGV